MLLTKMKNFSFVDLKGNSVSIEDFKGKNTLIFMWASWCRCREQLPGWQAFYETYKDQDFEILSVSVDLQGADVVKSYAADKSFTTVIDPHNQLANYLGFKVVPNGIFIDKEGIIRLVKKSFYVSLPGHVQAVETLLKGKAETVILDNETYSPANVAPSTELLLSETKFKLGMEYAQNGKKEKALKELDDALRLDPDNVIIRKQRWYLRYPEKFIPVIDAEWQKAQLAKEKEEEETFLKSDSDCSSEGCVIPQPEKAAETSEK